MLADYASLFAYTFMFGLVGGLLWYAHIRSKFKGKMRCVYCRSALLPGAVVCPKCGRDMPWKPGLRVPQTPEAPHPTG